MLYTCITVHNASGPFLPSFLRFEATAETDSVVYPVRPRKLALSDATCVKKLVLSDTKILWLLWFLFPVSSLTSFVVDEDALFVLSFMKAHGRLFFSILKEVFSALPHSVFKLLCCPWQRIAEQQQG